MIVTTKRDYFGRRPIASGISSKPKNAAENYITELLTGLAAEYLDTISGEAPEEENLYLLVPDEIQDGYGDPNYSLVQNDDTIVPVIGLQNRDKDSARQNPYTRLAQRLEDNTFLRVMPRSRDTVDARSEDYRVNVGQGTKLDGILDKSVQRIPEAERNLEHMVVQLGVPSPNTVPTVQPFSSDRDDFNQALANLPKPQPALHAIVERGQREGTAPNTDLYLNEIDSPASGTMTYRDA